MGGEHDDPAPVGDGPQRLQHDVAGRGVELGRRFVGEQQVGLDHERPGHRHALQLPARELLGQAVVRQLVLPEPRELQRGRRPLQHLGAQAGRRSAAELHVLARAEHRQQAVALQHDAEGPARAG